MQDNKEKSIRPKLFFWFSTPPKVSKGAFNYVSQYWGSEVVYVIDDDFSEYRKATNWNDGDFGNAKIIMLSQCDNEKKILQSIFDENPHAIHIISGFTNSIEGKIRKYILNTKVKLASFSERPDMMGGFFERKVRDLYFNFKYRRLNNRYKLSLNVFFPLGQKGVGAFVSYGWDRNIMYPFMYNPVCHKNVLEEKCELNDDIVKFIYVGRFYYKTKGIDTLMRASELLQGDWKLDLVGGYGNDKDKVIDWVKTQSNVQYIGSWQSQDVGANLSKYDVIVVPSKYDGWNLLPNEAIYAGIGTIVTDEAVSDEIIKSSGAGAVVPANDYKAMAKIMQDAIDNKALVDLWKSKTKIFVDKISSETVGAYLMEVLDYTFIDNNGQKPKCPWL